MVTQDTSNDPIALVFTMGKVGSSTVMEAFRQCGRLPERGYEANVDYLQPLSKYEVVVTPVRDPVARNISQFFELHGDDLSAKSFEEIYDIMLDQPAEEFLYPLTWFDNVFKPTFGIDVYKKRFNKKRGWSVINGRYILIQTERLNTLPYALENVIGFRPESVHRASTISDRWYGEAYKRFCEWVRFPDLHMFYESKYVRHFYTKEQIEKMEARWIL